MEGQLDEWGLTPVEREQARKHWDELMFAFCPVAREHARLALMEAASAVQIVVMADITSRWLQDLEPQRGDNPFINRV